MAFVNWSPNLSVGIEFIDADHQQSITLLTEFQELMVSDQPRAAVIEKLDELIEFSEQHFRLEERLMKQNNYREFGEHQAIHKKLLQQTADLRERLVTGATDIGPEVTDFLKDWLIRHILESDKHFGGFSRGN